MKLDAWPEHRNLQPLTPRQTEMLQLKAEGMESKEIAVALHLRPQTVKNTLSEAFNRLGAANGPHAVALALRQGIIS